MKMSVLWMVVLTVMGVGMVEGAGGAGTAGSIVNGGTTTSAGAHGGGKGGSPANTWTDPLEAAKKTQNFLFMRYLCISLGAMGFLIVTYRTAMMTYARVRLMSSQGSPRQSLFASISSPTFAAIKKHLLWAPFFKHRHNKEFQLSEAINVGTLPTRFQGIFLILYLAVNALLCAISIDWSQPSGVWLAAIRNRTGILSIINMIPLFIFAGRNNPLIALLGISFDTYNLMHRWFGRIVVFEAVVHTGAYMANKIVTVGIDGFSKSVTTVPFLTVGFISTIAFVVLLLQSPSMFRHAFYEVFLAVHFIVVLVAVITLYLHLAWKQNKWLPYVQAAIGIWIFDRGMRVAKILYRNCGKQFTVATFEALPGEAVRVSIEMPRPWDFKPGQHAYVYIPRLGYWTSHPFSVVWCDSADTIEYPVGEEKISQHNQDVTVKKTTMSMVIRRRTGFTDTLYNATYNAPNHSMKAVTIIEGPYGGHHCLDSYGTTVLFAGGIGITHQVPYVKHLVAGFANETISTRKITLVWSITSQAHLEWIRPWMIEILAMSKRRDCLKILLYVTRSLPTDVIKSPSLSVQMFHSRPNIGAILDAEMQDQVGTMGVTVCGPGLLSDDVRAQVRKRCHRGAIDFIEESFTW
ncbi:hypothetical protein BJ508DRAFT_17130 [Ascobolus immersus RN42]|uniref:ferric-chelate reductase (NADPH) n=1 Tax=Ascobolus immersus RN42 TaxID=1160509 RepID=A0A3N4I1H8_ASCIM|nr:hypothetical protein BJ508DRAFT_17130 [Ascobolus immersus RN42]